MIVKGYMYILLCANGLYYTGSTKNLEKRLKQHQNGEGANFTKKHLPVQLVYFEEFSRIDDAFYREKQVQGWSRKKKEALINGETNKLHGLAECKNETHSRNVASAPLSHLGAPLSHLGDEELPNGGFDSAQPPDDSAQPPDDSAQPPDDSAQPPDDSAQRGD